MPEQKTLSPFELLLNSIKTTTTNAIVLKTYNDEGLQVINTGGNKIEDLIDIIREEFKKSLSQAVQKAKEEQKSEIDKLKQKAQFDPEGETLFHDEYIVRGYHLAIDDVLKLLTQPKE